MTQYDEQHEPTESLILLAALPAAAIFSFGAVFVVNLGSFVLMPFAVCLESVCNAGSAASDRLVRILKGH